MKPLTITLEPEWQQRLQRLHQHRNLTYEEIVKLALKKYLAEVEPEPADDPLIGLFDFDNPNLAENAEIILQSVQFVKVNDKRLAVISADDWEALIEKLETIEDIQLAKQTFAELKSFAGERSRAGWLLWDDVKDDLA